MEKGRIAVPSDGTGGLNGIRSQHFGHCDVFTLIDIEKGAIKAESILNNRDHKHGGCMVPVNLLSRNDVNVIIVAGIGRRPLEGFKEVGIDVFIDNEDPKIEPTVAKFLKNELKKMDVDEACGGGGGNCH
jgi:predicted Fe-Mo cluster-binding NifX family protein